MTTDKLLLRRCLGETVPEDYIEWAVERLCDGVDTANLRILAGLSPVLDRDEIEPFFRRVCADLELDMPDLNAPVEETAARIQAAYLRGELPAREVVQMMASLGGFGERSSAALSFWADMNEELAQAGTEAEGCYYPTSALSSLDEAVRREWQLFDQAVRLQPPSGFRYFVMCSACGSVGAPTWQRRSLLRWLLRRPAPVHAQCAACGSSEYRGMTAPEVRAEYFGRLEKARGASSASAV